MFRRAKPPADDELPTIDVFMVNDGEILCPSGTTISLTRRESECLQILIRHSGHFVSWQQMAQGIWGGGEGPENDNAIRVFMCRLSQKLRIGKSSTQVESKQGYGWRLDGALVTDDGR